MLPRVVGDTYLITRDKDLLILDGYRGLRIMQPQGLWSVLEASGNITK